MPSERRKQIPADSLLQLRQRLDRLPRKSPERAAQIHASAELYGVSASTVYRAPLDFLKPRAVHRVDHGTPRLMPKPELERYCELVATLKLRTTNKAGRHLSTKRAIELLEEYGVETAQGLVRAPQGVLTGSTVNEYLTRWHRESTRATGPAPIIPSPARSRWAATGRSSAAPPASVPTVSARSRTNSSCRSPRWLERRCCWRP